MTDIGLFPAGATALLSAMLVLVAGALVTIGAALRAWRRSRRFASSLRDDPATAYAASGATAAVLALALAVTASEAPLEARQALDVWWLACVAGVLGGAALAGWGVRRRRRI
jgi:hypothetical protein